LNNDGGNAVKEALDEIEIGGSSPEAAAPSIGDTGVAPPNPY
jgi:hypothetical protein